MSDPKALARQRIEQLVDRFREHAEEYRRKGYNEHQTRVDYINPFFKALGWDMDNEQSFAEAYREVIHEDKVKVGSATKAPDYAFTLFGQRKFFVDAKKPSINIKDDIGPAFQVRRYGWSAKVPLSIVTDFEEFAIYDCTKKPKPTDKASVARIKYLTCDQYLEEFDFIWEVFAKENLPKGRFDKYVQSDTSRKGTTTVDDEFLKSIEEWRKDLATNIALNNKSLDEDEINFAVQKIIDRIIFMRMCEDRGVETYGRLKKAAEKGEVYANLMALFHEADDKYNSGLFDFKADRITPALTVVNKTLKNIIKNLYYPHSEYEFSVMPADILGSVYERFLGKTIRLTPAHYAKIEEKPEVRKAGGVYYTPKYVVDYIVGNTVGKLLEGKTPKEVSSITICDPSCGSGSFLIGAYQYLLDWHLKYYINARNSEKKEKGRGARDEVLTPDGKLTTAEKKRILLNNIYGVDIDPQAVEVTKLNLLLKALEGETQASINQQLQLFHERVLPNLSNNIKCGNSLIDTDYYDGQIDFGDERKIRPFNWKRAFPHVFGIRKSIEQPYYKIQYQKVKNLADETDALIEQLTGNVNEPVGEYGFIAGFDAIIGNPPYVLLQNLETREVFNYTLSRFRSAKYKIDTYQLFIEQSIKLLKKGGFLGFITPISFLKNIHSEPLRRLILENAVLRDFLLFGYPVFHSASVDTIVFVLAKGTATKLTEISVNKSDVPGFVEPTSRIRQLSFEGNPHADFNLHISSQDSELLRKILSRSNPLGSYCKAYFGIQTYDRSKYVSREKPDESYKPVIDGKNLNAFSLTDPVEYVRFVPEAIKSGGNEAVYLQDRICTRQIGKYPIATLVPAGIYTLNTIYNIYPKSTDNVDLAFLAGIINSRVTRYFWGKNNADEKRTFPKIKKEALLAIPIPEVNSNSNVYESIRQNVNQLIELNRDLKQTKLENSACQIKSHIQHCETKIDELVYELYGLTEEEIGIIENPKSEI